MNQLKAGAILNYIVIGLNSLVGILYTPFMLRMLGQTEYGIYSLAASVIAYLGIMDLGFGNAVIRYVAKYRAENNKDKEEGLLGMFSLIYIVIGLATLIVGCIIAFYSNSLFDKGLSPDEMRQTKIILYLLSFNLSITFLFNVYNSAITAYEDFIFQKVVQICRIILNTAVMIALLILGYKAIGLVVCQTAFNCVTQLLNYYYFKHKLRIKIKFGFFDKGLFIDVCRYSFWVFMAAIIDRIYWSTGPFILGSQIGPIAVAVFSVAMSLENIFLSFSTAISSVFLPKVTKMVTTHENDAQISDLFIRTGRMQFIIVFLFLSGFIILGKDFINLWAGPGYTESYMVTVLLFLGLIVPAIQNIGISILQARNSLRFRAISLLFIAIGCVVGQFFLSRQYGAIGCALAIFFTLLIGQGLIMNIYYWKRQHIDIFEFWNEIFKMGFPPALTAVVFGLFLRHAVLVENWLHFLIYGFVYTLVYLLVVYKFSLNNYEIELIKKPIVRLFRH